MTNNICYKKKTTTPIDTIIPGLIENIIHAIPPNKIKRSFDLVLDGGGFSGTHLLGALNYLHILRETGKIEINRVAGVSIGAITALLFQARRIDIAFNNYPIIREYYYTTCNLEIVATQLKAIEHILPTNFHTNCNLHISYFNIQQLKHITVSTFTSNKHLLDVIRRSIHVPWIFDKSITLQGKYIDGLYPYTFTFDPPINPTTETLFINLINLPWSSMVSVKHRRSTCESAIEGALLVHQFFKTGNNNHFCHTFTSLSIRGAAFITRVTITQIIVKIFAWIYLGHGELSKHIKKFLVKIINENHELILKTFKQATT